MSTDVNLNGLSDDSKIKEYIRNELMPRVFHDIPVSNLNVGMFSLISEYLSQTIEQQSFTNSFFFNEAFITKSVLPDSIYAHAAIFNLGYGFAKPSCCNFLFELKIDDLKKNATLNPNNGLYEIIIDKNTRFNIKSNGSVYSLDYDILIQFKDYGEGTNVSTMWNAQYVNMDDNFVAVNQKTPYILYRVSHTWLCLFVTASEYVRNKVVVVNNTTRGIPNNDKVVEMPDHICGFDVKYIDTQGNETQLDRNHILTVHSTVPDEKPYIHYIMDNCQTIRFIFQMNGTNYFVPEVNSKFEFTIYTCHGASANFTAFNNELEQPGVITSTSRYPNNANIMKAAFVIGASSGGVDIGTADLVRRQTIEAYNTANVISSDHDIDEWFKTFFFQNVLYPYFFKRRDDPWGRIWSGFLALKDSKDNIFRTNTLTGVVPYEVLYNNNDNTVSSNEIIIPPGWVWTYLGTSGDLRYTVTPFVGNGTKVEFANTSMDIGERFVFANPFGIRIQKYPFAIGYFNPWINESITSSKLTLQMSEDGIDAKDDFSKTYHATPIVSNIQRTFLNNYYKLTTCISPSNDVWGFNGEDLVRYRGGNNITEPYFDVNAWTYLKKPNTLMSESTPILVKQAEDGYLPFNPEQTYFCVGQKTQNEDGTWNLTKFWIQDNTEGDAKRIEIPVSGELYLTGSDELWGDGLDAKWRGYEVYFNGPTDITLTPTVHDLFTFARADSGSNYYRMQIVDGAPFGKIQRIIVSNATKMRNMTNYGETVLVRIGNPGDERISINVEYSDANTATYVISNAKAVYVPFEFERIGGQYVFDVSTVGENGILLYADMKSTSTATLAENIDYYRMPLNLIGKNEPIFYAENKLIPVELNNMRVVLTAMINGSETGHVEMIPIKKDEDGTYEFFANMYPLNQLVGLDNLIHIASRDVGGGTWIPASPNTSVNVTADNPEFKISILVRSKFSTLTHMDGFEGFRLVDEFKLDDFSLVQELKEMRSVVEFGESAIPTQEEIDLYNSYTVLNKTAKTPEEEMCRLYPVTDYVKSKIIGKDPIYPKEQVQQIAINLESTLLQYNTEFEQIEPDADLQAILKQITNYVHLIAVDAEIPYQGITWEDIFNVFNNYDSLITEAFKNTNVTGGMKVKLVPFVESDLMIQDQFKEFVSSFVNVHKSIEPVIMTRLEGNNYLDCKLIATYGLPHSYVPDTLENTSSYWPDLDVQIEFDVKLNNIGLATTTISALKDTIKTYFARLTSIHTVVDDISMDNNIYISTLIKQMESNENVAFLKFRGWYTNDKNTQNGFYMDANTQAIVMKRKSFEEFTTEEMESFVPEMFILKDDNIVINII